MFSLFEILKTQQKVTLYSFIKQLNIEYLPFISTVPGLEIVFKNRYDQAFLEVQWLGHWAAAAGGKCSIPGWGTKIPHVLRSSQNKQTNNNGALFSPLTPPQSHQTYTGLGKQTFGGHKQNLVCTRTQEKGGVNPQETDPDLPVRIQGSGVCPGWPAVGLGALSVALLACDL